MAAPDDAQENAHPQTFKGVFRAGRDNSIGNTYNIGGGNVHFHGSQAGQNDTENFSVGVHSSQGVQILKWLNQVDFQSGYREAINNHNNNGTGQGFLTSSEYLKWKSGDPNLLWCKGIPGAGKSVLMALAVEDLASISAEDVFVGCVFFNRERHQQITTSMVLGSLLVQFINMRDIIPSDIVRTWVAHQEDSSLPHSRIMGSMLLTELRRFSKSFIIIDALDECPSQTQRELLFSLCAAQRDHPALHLLVSSRNMGGIGEDTDLDQAPVFEISAQAKDLHLYIENQVKIKHGLRLCRKNEDLLTQLKTTLIQKANGLFLLVVLHLEFINKRNVPNRKFFKNLLEDIDKESIRSLDSTYESMWQYIQNRAGSSKTEERVNEINFLENDIAMEIITWVTFARRPLFLSEIVHALASKYIQAGKYDADYEYDEALLTSQCLGLIVEFFVTRLRQFLPQAHFLIGSICLRYLSIHDLRDCDNQERIEYNRKHFSFFHYATQHWAFHVESAGSLSLNDKAVEFLGNSHFVLRTLRNSLAMSTEVSVRAFKPQLPLNAAGVHLAAYVGLPHEIWLPSDQLLDLDHKDDNNWTLLRWAVFGGHKKTVEYLINSGCDVDLQDHEHNTTLMWALQMKTDHYAQSDYGKVIAMDNSTLHCGYRYAMQPLNIRPKSVVAAVCSLDIIELLINASRNIDIEGQFGRTALLQAAYNQQFGYVRRLIMAGADINKKDHAGRTALLNALQIPMRTIVFDDIEVRNEARMLAGDTIAVLPSAALATDHTAADNFSSKADEEDIMQLVGTDVNCTDVLGICALSLAAVRGFRHLVRLLLDRGANVNQADVWKSTPLHRVCARTLSNTLVFSYTQIFDNSRLHQGSQRFIKCSLGEEKQVENDLHDFYRDRIEICKILLEKHAEKDKPDAAGLTPFDLAKSAGYQRICVLLDESRAASTGFEFPDLLDLEGEDLVFQAYGTLTQGTFPDIWPPQYENAFKISLLFGE